MVLEAAYRQVQFDGSWTVLDYFSNMTVQSVGDIVVPYQALHRFTISEYEALGQAEFQPHRARTELIAGQVVDKTSSSDAHSASVGSVSYDFIQLLAGAAWIRSEQAIALPDQVSMPEPDICVCKVRADRYASGKPQAADILLLVEVAASSLKYDRTTKAQLYGAAGIPEYWIINLIDRQLERYVLAPDSDDYAAPVVHAEFGSFHHHLLGDLHVSTLLPMLS